MSNNIRSFLGMLAPMVPMQRLIDLTHQHILLPFYHSVTAAPLPHIKHLYQNRSISQFKSDLDFLNKHYRSISIEELYEIVNENRQIDQPVFHLTFDDGLAEFYSVAAPLLKERKVSASVFLNSAFVDNQDLFFRYKASLLIGQLSTSSDFKSFNDVLHQNLRTKSQIKEALLGITYNKRHLLDTIAKNLGYSFEQYLELHQPYLSKQQIEELISQGFVFGSHSVDHPLFGDLPLADQKNQVEKSFNDLSEYMLDNKYFAFPFDDARVSKEFIDWLYHGQQCKLSFGTSGLKDDVYKQHLHRLPMEGDALPARQIIKTEYLYYFLKSFFNKNSISRS